MTTKELTSAILAWCEEVLPDLAGGYDHATDERLEGLPDVGVEIVETRITNIPPDDRLRKLQSIEQMKMQIWDLEIIIVVPPEPADAAEDMVKEFSDTLLTALNNDPSLGNRVNWVNKQPRVSFRPPFVEFDDGTRGRIATLFMQVGQLVEV